MQRSHWLKTGHSLLQSIQFRPAIPLLLIPSAVYCMYTDKRLVRPLCDCVKVCMQSLEVSAECWQVDSLWAWGLHSHPNPFLHHECLIQLPGNFLRKTYYRIRNHHKTRVLFSYNLFQKHSVTKLLRDCLLNILLINSRYSSFLSQHKVRRIRAANFSSNRSKILNFI